jgi:hypothetical protein
MQVARADLDLSEEDALDVVVHGTEREEATLVSRPGSPWDREV